MCRSRQKRLQSHPSQFIKTFQQHVCCLRFAGGISFTGCSLLLRKQSLSLTAAGAGLHLSGFFLLMVTESLGWFGLEGTFSTTLFQAQFALGQAAASSIQPGPDPHIPSLWDYSTASSHKESLNYFPSLNRCPGNISEQNRWEQKRFNYSQGLSFTTIVCQWGSLSSSQ